MSSAVGISIGTKFAGFFRDAKDALRVIAENLVADTAPYIYTFSHFPTSLMDGSTKCILLDKDCLTNEFPAP